MIKIILNKMCLQIYISNIYVWTGFDIKQPTMVDMP